MQIARWITSQLLLLWVLAFAAGPAWAQDHHGGGDHHEPASHGADSHDGHGGDHADGGHDEGHGHHIYYTDDDDEDSIPNWRDPVDGVRKGSPEAYVVDDLFWHALNLSILLGLVVWGVRQPLGDVFRERERAIRNELTETSRERDDASQRQQDLLARLEKIEGEVEAMHTDAKAAAEREEAALIERAEREAGRIADQAKRTIRDEATRARNDLRREAVDLAVQLAENTLRSQVASTDQRALAQDFLDSLKRGA